MPMTRKRIGLEDVFTYTWFMFEFYDALPLLASWHKRSQLLADCMAGAARLRTCVGLLKKSDQRPDFCTCVSLLKHTTYVHVLVARASYVVEGYMY